MALIQCIECGKMFSDRAPACPECGCPTSEIIGKKSNSNEGEILVANNAFDDGRYDEAYQLYTQLYVKDQLNPQIVVRLGLATVAKDYFSNGIPNSTKELFAKGLELAKSKADSYDSFVEAITPYVNDCRKVILDTNLALANELSSALDKTEPTRGAGSMVVDALFAPMDSANRNLYEDRRAAAKNNKILTNALNNKKEITATLDAFSSYVLRSVANILTKPLDNDSLLYTTLGDFVIGRSDAEIYEKLSANKKIQENVYGLCYGEEKNILVIKDNTSFYYINGKPHASGGFAPPKGNLLLTNYKVVYKATKDKFSFEKPLNELVRVEIGGPGSWQTHIVLVFPKDVKVLITPPVAGMQAAYVSMINEELKMHNR